MLAQPQQWLNPAAVWYNDGMPEKPKQNIIAIVYDFDGTFSPGNIQEDTIFKAYGIDKNQFWADANELVKKRGYERTLSYLKLLIHAEPFRNKPLDKARLRAMAVELKYFPGVLEYFDLMTAYMQSIPEVEKHGITLEHYIVSSGLTEILEGTVIARHFKKIYACEYDYEGSRPVFPKLVINDTNKTQFLFRINKGKLDLSEDINSHMPEDERRIPFRNMIYIGDGSTDIPSMTVTQKSGGHALAVFPPDTDVPAEVADMVQEKRADHFAPADYRDGKLLVKILQLTIKKIALTIAYRASSRRSFDWIAEKRKPAAANKR